MRKRIVLSLAGFLVIVCANAQKVKPVSTDTTKAYRANDRLKSAGPSNGWPAQTPKTDTLKVPKDTALRIQRKVPTRRTRTGTH